MKDLAGRAQADLGMDYSWLEDVTYQDWQRYHDLARREYGLKYGSEELIINDVCFYRER